MAFSISKLFNKPKDLPATFDVIDKIDFKGGTLIELRSNDSKINVSSLRDNLNQMNLGDISVKKFGNETDFLIKFEKSSNKNEKFISELKNSISGKIGSDINFRRVENVGPKVSAELLASMYDASLNQFKPHDWNFNPIQNPIYHAHGNPRANRSLVARAQISAGIFHRAGVLD